MISAVILAAGESKRMGKPKMLLRWGDRTVLEHVLTVFGTAGFKDISIVTGSHHIEIEKIISKTSMQFPARSIFNDKFSTGGMLSSLQCGLRELSRRGAGAAMIGLGDQPQVQEGTVRALLDEYQSNENSIIVPSFEMRRGHPWVIPEKFWGAILEMKSPLTLRDFLNARSVQIHYTVVDTPSILMDIDTPQDYEKSRPK